MVKGKMTEKQTMMVQNTTQKTKDRAIRTALKQRVLQNGLVYDDFIC